ncbi:MAG: DUF3486 domain-containing protein [Trueperaceae bacterium]|nr:DUF3486 domain-containing protein [Trueperaceae bacterium]
MEIDHTPFLLTERRCKVCTSPVRKAVDAMLLGETRGPDDQLLTYEAIIEFAAGEGVTLTASSLSRHRHNHLQPSLQMALETQRHMDAIAEATGRRLTLHSAVANVIVTKTLRLLDDMDVREIGPERLLRVALRAAEVGLKLERAEAALSPEVAKTIDDKLSAAGLAPVVLEKIRREV